MNALRIMASVFVNDDESGLHEDCKEWLERLVPHASTRQYLRNRTNKACLERSEGTTPLAT